MLFTFKRIREGNIADRFLLDLRYSMVNHAVFRFRSLHSRRHFGFLLVWLPHSRSGGTIASVSIQGIALLILIYCQQTKSFGLCLFFFLYCMPLSFITFCYYFIVSTIFEHEKTLREQAKRMNVASLRTNSDANATSAEIRIAKVALCNIALWAAMWTPYAAIVLKACLKWLYHNKFL